LVKKATTAEHVKIEQMFRDAYGRDITAQERKMFGLASEAFPAADPGSALQTSDPLKLDPPEKA
jgi:hypothetical protein